MRVEVASAGVLVAAMALAVAVMGAAESAEVGVLVVKEEMALVVAVQVVLGEEERGAVELEAAAREAAAMVTVGDAWACRRRWRSQWRWHRLRWLWWRQLWWRRRR
jgi:hypothetical protein